MSSTLFEVVEHSIPCQHIREYPRATKSRQEEVLHLSINQYKPLKTANSCEDGVTIIAAHANGIPKVRRLQNVYVALGNGSFGSYTEIYSNRKPTSRCGTIS